VEWESGYVDPENGWKYITDSTAEAHQKYSNPSEALNSQTWDSRGLENSQVYNSGPPYLNPNNPEQGPWLIRQPQGDKSQPQGVGDSQFQGGIAGKCPPSQNWVQADGKWKCSGEPSWKQAVALPEIIVEEDTAEIGMIVMPYN